MCRSVDYYDFRSGDQSLLKIKAFFVRFSDFDSCADPLSDSLTLLFPPRINDTARLEISGSITGAGSPAFVTLHRLVKLKTRDGEAIYGSRERIRAGDGVRFEVYSREEKVLNGVLRREEEKWKMECKCALESDNTEMIGGKAAVADVCVAVEGDLAMGERVEMVVRKCRKNRRMGFDQLEDIPEEREGESERDGGFCCSCGEADSGGEEVDIEAAGVSWAFDVGIWIMCFGVGYFVSKATAKSLRRMRLL
ncbi:uncharacterized protein LOC108478337 [Gossypium arboreum]|uniref:Uncharacterized protein n=1 Tax=Gossypium arboreum TaxID=29729 RepID=A0ABR0MUX6_GOSAR|nr:uncharacterized protein LOC108478337 [Gossypium arboreum]KAK5777786.1 hypothetical protein PVK06_045753 [Gossypium arboreum]